MERIKNGVGKRQKNWKKKKQCFFGFFPPLKEEWCKVWFLAIFQQHNFTTRSIVTTITFMKGAKQPEAFLKESL